MSSQAAGQLSSSGQPRSRAAEKRVGLGAVVLGLVLTGAFYATAPFTPGISGFVQRYFCSHLLEYISTAMFFVGVAILLGKLRHLPRERRSLTQTQQSLHDSGLHEASGADQDQQRQVRAWFEDSTPAVAGTQLGQRLAETLQYVRCTRRDGLEEHLKYLAELAGERLHQSFAMIRTITWAIPILGFLGTVIGITMAIANVTPEQLDSSLGEVTGGLAVAFDTTALALGMSIVMVFASFVVERCEQSILNDVEQFGIDHLLPLFGPRQSAGETTNRVDDQLTRTLLTHSAAWTQQLTELRASWHNVLNEQTAELTDRLGEDVQQTLQLHRDSVLDARDSYTDTLQQNTADFAQRIDETMGRFESRVESWQQAMLTSSQAAAAQTEAIHQLGRTLLQLTESEERLAQLQQQLNQNLQALQVVDTLEQTAGSLTAAVHILTAKTSLRNAA